MKPTINELKNTICEACGDEFSCSPDSGRCWCFDFEIEKTALLEIEKQFGNCLCVSCLCRFSANFDDADFTTVKTSL